MANLHVLRLDGEIDVAQRQRIERELAVIEGFGADAIVILDLTDVVYVDTTFLNALIRLRNRTDHAQRDDSIRLVAPTSNSIWQLFEITKLDSVFPLFDTMEAATRPVAFTERHALLREFEASVWARTYTQTESETTAERR
jgi:anti-anti-sigma factor